MSGSGSGHKSSAGHATAGAILDTHEMVYGFHSQGRRGCSGIPHGQAIGFPRELPGGTPGSTWGIGAAPPDSPLGHDRGRVTNERFSNGSDGNGLISPQNKNLLFQAPEADLVSRKFNWCPVTPRVLCRDIVRFLIASRLWTGEEAERPTGLDREMDMGTHERLRSPPFRTAAAHPHGLSALM